MATDPNNNCLNCARLRRYGKDNFCHGGTYLLPLIDYNLKTPYCAGWTPKQPKTDKRHEQGQHNFTGFVHVHVQINDNGKVVEVRVPFKNCVPPVAALSKLVADACAKVLTKLQRGDYGN